MRVNTTAPTNFSDRELCASAYKVCTSGRDLSWTRNPPLRWTISGDPYCCTLATMLWRNRPCCGLKKSNSSNATECFLSRSDMISMRTMF